MRIPGGRDGAVTLRVVVIGSGVVGLLSARRALDAGHRVCLVEREVAHPSAAAASWGGTRIIRDDLGTTPPGLNTQRWRQLLAGLGGAISTAPGVTHVRGAPTPLAAAPPGETVTREEQGFVVDTHAVFHALLTRLRSDWRFELVDGAQVCEVDDDAARVHAADGRTFEGDLVVVAAGTASAGMLNITPAVRSEAHVQACALLQPDSAHGRSGGMPAFIYTGDNGEGAWGTPSLAGHPAKISAPDLCFRSQAEAVRFNACENLVRRFLDRTRGLLPALQDDDVLRWEYGTYAAACGPTMFKGRTTRALLACDGGGFKRAPAIADQLLET